MKLEKMLNPSFSRYKVIQSNTKANLTTFKPNYYWKNTEKTEEMDFIRLAYRIKDFTAISHIQVR